MTFSTLLRWLLPLMLALGCTGCGTVAAHLLARAPNRYPDWFDAEAPVTLAFSPKLLTNFTAHVVAVGPPAAQLSYRVVEPADYGLKITSTNWLDHGRKEFQFDFRATVPGRSNVWTTAPRGTVVLLHGYGLAQFSMMPWALRLGEAGWRCVLVDLRGHGRSTGKQIYFGKYETRDLSQLLDALARDGQLQTPVAAMGESYGAALALRWQAVDPRIQAVVAVAPYASLSNAVLNIRRDYAAWMPAWIIRSGLIQLPKVLDQPASELDTTTALRRQPVRALLVAGAEDQIAPVSEVERLHALMLPGSRLLVVPEATHESLTYYFSDLLGPVLSWLERAN